MPLSFEELNESLGLDVTRMIVLLEDSPQSNKYRQMEFSQEQFKMVSDAVGKAFNETPRTDGEEGFSAMLKLGEIIATLPDNTQDFYPQ